MTWTGAADAQRYEQMLLEGGRVRFRTLEDEDLPDLVRWWRDPEWAVLRQTIARPRPEEPVVEMFRSWSKGERSGDVGFSVVDRTSSELVGHVTLSGAKLPVRAATLAVMIGREHVGTGYGTDAVRLLTAYGFREMGLNRTEVQVHAFNDRASGVRQGRLPGGRSAPRSHVPRRPLPRRGDHVGPCPPLALEFVDRPFVAPV